MSLDTGASRLGVAVVWTVAILSILFMTQRASKASKAFDREDRLRSLEAQLSTARQKLSVLESEVGSTQEALDLKAQALERAEDRLDRVEKRKGKLERRALKLEFDRILRNISSSSSGGSEYPEDFDPYPDQSDYFDPCLDLGECGDDFEDDLYP